MATQQTEPSGSDCRCRRGRARLAADRRFRARRARRRRQPRRRPARFAALTPASVDPRLAAFVAERSSGNARLMRFTPAGAAERASRSVTVAVRVDENSARAISVRSAIEAAHGPGRRRTGVRIAPTRYNLGVSRGYQSFAQAHGAGAVARAVRRQHSRSRRLPPVARAPRTSRAASPRASRSKSRPRPAASPRTIDSPATRRSMSRAAIA